MKENIIFQSQEVSVKNKLDSLFFTRLFVPQASQSSPYRRAEFDIRLAIPSTLKRLRNGDFYEYITGM